MEECTAVQCSAVQERCAVEQGKVRLVKVSGEAREGGRLRSKDLVGVEGLEMERSSRSMGSSFCMKGRYPREIEPRKFKCLKAVNKKNNRHDCPSTVRGRERVERVVRPANQKSVGSRERAELARRTGL